MSELRIHRRIDNNVISLKHVYHITIFVNWSIGESHFVSFAIFRCCVDQMQAERIAELGAVQDDGIPQGCIANNAITWEIR